MEKSSLNEPLAFWQNFFHILQKYYVSLYMQNSVKAEAEGALLHYWSPFYSRFFKLT